MRRTYGTIAETRLPHSRCRRSHARRVERDARQAGATRTTAFGDAGMTDRADRCVNRAGRLASSRGCRRSYRGRRRVAVRCRSAGQARRWRSGSERRAPESRRRSGSQAHARVLCVARENRCDSQAVEARRTPERVRRVFHLLQTDERSALEQAAQHPGGLSGTCMRWVSRSSVGSSLALSAMGRCWAVLTTASWPCTSRRIISCALGTPSGSAMLVSFWNSL